MFRDHFGDHLGDTIVEIRIQMSSKKSNENKHPNSVILGPFWGPFLSKKSVVCRSKTSLTISVCCMLGPGKLDISKWVPKSTMLGPKIDDFRCIF